MPLRALLEGKDFFAEDLTEENRKNIFTCPNCPSQLIPVIPQKEIINHFRHKNGEAHYEPETIEHFTGKQKLKQLVQSLGYEATTEYRIGKHITDVYVKSMYIPLAIEFQCSKCNADEIADRSITYAENGVATLWILGPTFNEDALTDKQTKIEDMIERSQPIVRFNGTKFLIKRKQEGWSKKRFYDYHEYSISYHIERMLKGFCPNNCSELIEVHGIAINFDEDKDSRLLQAASVLARKTLEWKNDPKGQILYINEHSGILNIILTWGHTNGIEIWISEFGKSIDEAVSDHWEIRFR